jgi:hypothetical protein
MFMVSEDERAAIRAAFDRGGELSATVEVRRLFPGITDNANARRCALTIAGWPAEWSDKPHAQQPAKVARRPARKRA